MSDHVLSYPPKNSPGAVAPEGIYPRCVGNPQGQTVFVTITQTHRMTVQIKRIAPIFVSQNWRLRWGFLSRYLRQRVPLQARLLSWSPYLRSSNSWCTPSSKAESITSTELKPVSNSVLRQSFNFKLLMAVSGVRPPTTLLWRPFIRSSSFCRNRDHGNLLHALVVNKKLMKVTV